MSTVILQTWKQNNPEKVSVYNKKYHQKNKERLAQYYQKNKEKISQKHKIYRNKNREKIRIRNLKYNFLHKKDNKIQRMQTKVKNTSIVIWHYSKGTYSCACCGLHDGILFLQIDHIDGNGNKHRKSIGKKVIFRWLIRNNLPKGFRILCGSCNHARFRNGGTCPHQENLITTNVSTEDYK